MANHDDQFHAESTPVADTTSPSSANVTAIHNPPPLEAASESRAEQALDTQWDADKTEVLTESLDSQTLSAWLTDSLGFDIEMSRFPFVVGRSDDCDLTPNGRGLSRRHAEIIFHSGRFVIRDLDSLNGIKVNGCKVSRVILDDGDEIAIGDTQFTFRHRIPTNQPLNNPTQPPLENNGKWLKASAVVVAALVVIVGGLSVFQNMNRPNPTTAAEQTSSSPAPATQPATQTPPEIAATTVSTTTPTTAETITPPPTAKKATAPIPPRGQVINKTLPPPRLAQIQNPRVKPPELAAKTTKPVKTIKPVKTTQLAKAAPAPTSKQQRQESTRVAKRLLQSANEEYLSGKATQIIRQLKIASLSKNLPASTKREVTKKYNLLNQLHGYYTSGNVALKSNNKDKAFESWDKYLDQLDLNFPGEMPTYAKEVTRYMADEYALRAQQASGTKQYQLAYQFWQKAFSLNGNPTAENQIALIEEKAHQLYRQGLRQEYVNSAKAKKLWQQVVKLVPPSSETFTKANAKLTWYTRWEE